MILFTLDHNTTPEAYLEQRLGLSRQAGAESHADVFALRFRHVAYYLPGSPHRELLALVSIEPGSNQAAEPEVRVCIFPMTTAWVAIIESLAAEPAALADFCRTQGLAQVLLCGALMLVPVFIPKPWGQEIWYTGIEARGQAGVMGQGGCLPLPWVLEFVRSRLALLENEQLILLKVLDPLAESPYGDLYFELHEQKQEVYVVTHVDQTAWPDGKGAIQLGFNPELRTGYTSADEFKAAYLSAVKAYEQVRRSLDHALDRKKQALNLPIDQPVPLAQLKLWLKELSQELETKALFSREQELKSVMDSFVAQHSLGLGDVVAVPRLVPHALQHGVRVVEFQTPVYERKILSFGQKVLTQAHWDTEAALELVDMDTTPFIPPVLLHKSDEVEIQQIVNFDEFEVQRIKLMARCRLPVPRYALLMVLEGEVEMEGGKVLLPGSVVLLPATRSPQMFYSQAALFLWAVPRLDGA